MIGQNIICFGSENWDYNGFQQNTMRLLSRDNNVLYFNAIGARKITFRLSQLRFYTKRIRRILQQNSKPSENTMVLNPRIIPLVYNDLIAKINKILLKTQFAKVFSKTSFQDYILWIGTPTAVFLLDLLDPVLTVYNPVDRYYSFSFVNSPKIINHEQQIAKKSDVILCTSDGIRDDLLPYNQNCYTITHGVHFDHFHSAYGSTDTPEKIRDIPKPIIGYFGKLMSDFVNHDLLYEVATRYPHANVVLIGKKLPDLNKLGSLPNVHLCGFVDHRELPLYLKEFAVCLIPYHINKANEACDPIKLREYLCLGKPVVSVDLPEVRKLDGLVYIAESENDYVEKVGKAMNEAAPNLIKARMLAAKESDWSAKIVEISGIINEAIVRKRGYESCLSISNIRDSVELDNHRVSLTNDEPETRAK
jgi:glycosyltransferase involved in cell wall biosynthesis